MTARQLIVVVADINNNLVDGSVVWLLNAMRALTSSPSDAHRLLLLREVRAHDGLLFPRSLHFAGAEILDPRDLKQFDDRIGESLLPEHLPQVLASLEERRHAQIQGILVRGAAFSTVLLSSERFRDATCVYTTERPSFASTYCSTVERDTARHAKHIFVQSEALKRYYEVYLQARLGSLTVFPPMVDTGSSSRPDLRKEPVLSYAGKLDSQYCVEELVDLAPDLMAHGARIQIIGNKFNRTEGDPGFIDRLRGKLQAGAIEWIEGATHENTQRSMRMARFGYCVRNVALDNSIELSTKLIEYCAQGTPPILRRTSQHVQLLGPDYPYFADSQKDVVNIVASSHADERSYLHICERLLDVARKFDLSHAHARLAPLYARVRADEQADRLRRKVIVATHDDKFLAAALQRLDAEHPVEIRRDTWISSQSRAADAEPDGLKDADAIFCEWCCEQAVWWSRHKRAGQTLIVRLHRFEAFTDSPRSVDWSAVDHLIVVSDYFKRMAVDKFGAPERIVRVLPQFVDTAEFDRPKLPGADFTVGLVGINAFSHKRPDRAIDFIEALVRKEPRFRLRIRSRMPWEFKWVWDDRPAEREAFKALFERCMTGPLKGRVLFDRAGSDMPEWFRGVGFVLSSSDTEGCHTSVAEGMASGARPVCHAWPGAVSVYGTEFVHESIDGMVAATLNAMEEARSADGRARMKQRAARFDIANTVETLKELIR
jgi:glycosyltransferase involved in cell wall biosynthesis